MSVGSLRNQPGDPVRERARLPRAGTRDHENVSAIVRRRRPLLRSKFLLQDGVDVGWRPVHTTASRSADACALTNGGGIAFPTSSAAAYLPRFSERR